MSPTTREIRNIASGLRFPEGPIAMADGSVLLVEIERFVMAHDCGTVLNPLIVDGQIHGGVSIGIGNAYYEKLHFDETGQLLNASFADYLVPSATEMPRIQVGHIETRSPLNELGTKGVGEAGTIPVPALFAQTIEDALADRDIEILESPLSPNRLYELLKAEEAR